VYTPTCFSGQGRTFSRWLSLLEDGPSPGGGWEISPSPSTCSSSPASPRTPPVCVGTRVQVCIPANAEAPDAAAGADAMRTVALESVRRLEEFSSDGAGVGALLMAGPVLIAVSDVGQVTDCPPVSSDYALSSHPQTPSDSQDHSSSSSLCAIVEPSYDEQ
jgi:hypothetical protein